MTETTQFGVTVIAGKAWSFIRPSCGDPFEAPLGDVLRWILEQIHLNNYQWTPGIEGDGNPTSLVVGLRAAPDATKVTVDEVAQEVRDQLWRLNLAAIFAKGREEGVSDADVELAENVRLSATEGAYHLTDVYYAFELFKILNRIRDKSYVFASLPVRGKTKPRVLTLLREATRAYLFNLNWSCVSTCRTLLEACLRERVSLSELLEERFRSKQKGEKKGDIECLINAATNLGRLERRLANQAHRIRMAANDAIHGTEPTDEEAWAVLLDTREVVEALYS